jgi:hypothetical protein
MKKLNGKISKQGYKRNSPDNTNDFNIIPSGRISMHNVPHMVYGIDNLGNEKIMVPGEEYQFPGNQVTEIPMNKKQLGGGNKYNASSNFALDPSYLKNTVKQQKERELPMTAKQKKEIDKQQRLAAIKRDPRNYHVSDYINHGIPEPGLEESMSPLDLIGPAEGKMAMKLINRVASTGEKMLPKITNTINQAYKVNPWAENLNNPLKSYRVAGIDAAKDFENTGVLRSVTPSNSKAASLLERAQNRPTAFPSFQKGYADMRYAPEEGAVVFETALPTFKRGEINPVTGFPIKGRHYAHRVIDPKTGATMTEIPGSEIKMFGDKPHWLKGYKEVPKELPDYMSLEAPKGNMYGQNQTLTQQSRLLNPEVKAKFFENQAQHVEPDFSKKDLFQSKFVKIPRDYGNRITPENYEDFVKNVHGSTDYGIAEPTGFRSGNLGVGNYGKPGMVFSDAPLNNLGKDIINAHEKNHGMFAGTLSKEMRQDLLKPFGTSKPVPKYGAAHQPDEVLARMAQFKNAIGMGDNQTFTLDHLNLIRKNYAKSFLDNGITEMLAKIKPGSSGEKEFLKNMNKYAFGIGVPTAIGAATITSQPKKQKGGGYFNPTLDPAFLQNTVQDFNQQEAKLTPQQKAELEKQRKLEYLKAHPEKYNVGYYQQYKKSEPGLEESVSPLDFLGPAEIKAVGKLASKVVGKLARVGEKVLPKVAAKSAKEIEAAADLAKFREKFAKYQKEGLSPELKKTMDEVDIELATNKNSLPDMTGPGKIKEWEKDWFESIRPKKGQNADEAFEALENGMINEGKPLSSTSHSMKDFISDKELAKKVEAEKALLQFGKQPNLNNADFINPEQADIDRLFNMHYDQLTKEINFPALIKEAEDMGISPDALLKRNLEKLMYKSERPLGSKPFYMAENPSVNNRALLRSNPNYSNMFAKDLNEIGPIGGSYAGELSPMMRNQISTLQEQSKLTTDPVILNKIQEKLQKIIQKGYKEVNGEISKTPYTGIDAFQELTPNKKGGSSGYTKGMKPANGKLFSNIVKQAKSRFKVLNTPTVKAWIDAQYHNAGGNYHYDYNTRQFGGDNNEINTIMKNNNLSTFVKKYQAAGAVSPMIPLTPEQQWRKDHPTYGNNEPNSNFNYAGKYTDETGATIIPRYANSSSAFGPTPEGTPTRQELDTSYMMEGDRYFQLYGDKKIPISNITYRQAQKRLGFKPGLTPPTQYNRAFGGAPSAEEFFNFGMPAPSFAFYADGGESDCPECDEMNSHIMASGAMMLDEDMPGMKGGGNWIQNANLKKGRCTPGSPNYDCPKGSPQWNLAQTFKKHNGFQKKQDGGGTDGNFNNINDAPQYAQDTFLNALKTQTQQALAKQEYENMEQMHQAFMQMGGNIPAQQLQWRDRSQDSPIQNMNELINPIVNRFDNDGQPNFGDNAYSESGVPTEWTQRSNADKLLQSQYNAQQNAIAKAKAMGLGQFVYKQMGGNSLPKAQYGPLNYDPNAPMQNSYEVTPEMQWQSTANQIAFQPDNSEQQYEGDNPLGLDLSSQAYQPKRQDIGDDSPEEQFRFNGEAAANYEMAGINKLSEYLERKQRKPYEDKLKQRQNADAVFTPLGANMNSRGDYDVNSGMFRPDQMVPIQNRGYAKFGGGYQSGGEYFLDDNEIQQILDAGGQVEYLD